MKTAEAAFQLGGRISRRMQEVPPSSLRRFFEIGSVYGDVISLGIGEPDFTSPHRVIEAGTTSLQSGQTNYTSNAGIFELRELLVDDLWRHSGVRYDPQSEVMITVGASEAITAALFALLDPGDEILIPEPCFVSYGPLAILAGAGVRYVKTEVENNFEVTPEEIEASIGPRTKVLFLSYPNNPTGAVLRRDRLNAIAEIVQAHGLLVISDEIYSRLIYGRAHADGHVCVSSVESLKERTVLIGGFSKNYAMTGWRIGFLCAPADLCEGIYRIHQYVVMSAPTMGQFGAMAALRYCEDDLERMRQSYDQRRRIMVDGLRSIGLPTFEPEGAFFCFPDVRPTGLSSETFASRLLEEEHVACVPGNAFGPSGEGFVRCCYATTEENLDASLHRMGRFVSRYTL